MTKSFLDEDWTAFSKEQIKATITSELEEQQCKKNGHRWASVFYCKTCGSQSSKALTKITKKKTEPELTNQFGMTTKQRRRSSTSK